MQHDTGPDVAAERPAGEFLAPFSRPRFAAGVAAVLVAVMALFTLFPGLDLAASAVFYSPGLESWDDGEWSCRAYSLACHAILSPLREMLHVLPLALGGVLLVVTLWRAAKVRSIVERQVLRYAAAFWSLIVGNMLLIETILKQSWGRPRPYHEHIDLERFADYVFMPVGDWRGACTSNCSFASGEAFALFWMVCATAILPERVRRTAFLIALPVAIFGALLRVAFGAHYLSDVTVAALLAALVFSLFAILGAAIERWWLYRKSAATA